MKEMPFQLIVDELQSVFPENWKKVAFYAQYTEGSYTMKYYVQNSNDEYIDCFDLQDISQINIMKVFRNINKLIAPIRNELSEQEQWSVMTLMLDSKGNFRTEYDYSDMTEKMISFQDKWKEKYL